MIPFAHWRFNGKWKNVIWNITQKGTWKEFHSFLAQIGCELRQRHTPQKLPISPIVSLHVQERRTRCFSCGSSDCLSVVSFVQRKTVWIHQFLAHPHFSRMLELNKTAVAVRWVLSADRSDVFDFLATTSFLSLSLILVLSRSVWLVLSCPCHPRRHHRRSHRHPQYRKSFIGSNLRRRVVRPSPCYNGFTWRVSTTRNVPLPLIFVWPWWCNNNHNNNHNTTLPCGFMP